MTKVHLTAPLWPRQWIAICFYAASIAIFFTSITYVVETVGHLVLAMLGLVLLGLVLSHGFRLVGDIPGQVILLKAMHGRIFYLVDEREDDLYFYRPEHVGGLMLDLGIALPNDIEKLRWMKQHDIVRFIKIEKVIVKRYIGVRDDKSAMAYRLKWC